MPQQTLVQSLRQAIVQGNPDLVTELIAALLVDVGYLPTVQWFEEAGGFQSAPGCWSAALTAIEGTYKAAVIQNVIHTRMLIAMWLGWFLQPISPLYLVLVTVWGWSTI